MTKEFNKWCLMESDIGNTEPYQYTKSEVMDFAKYYHDNKKNELDCLNETVFVITFYDYTRDIIKYIFMDEETAVNKHNDLQDNRKYGFYSIHRIKIS